MSKVIVVAEGQADVAILRAILNIPSDDSNVSFVSAGGWSSADSYARTALVENDGDVALVVDADSVDPSVVEQRKRFLQRSLDSIPSRRKFCVTVIAPEIEALLFKDRSILELLVDCSVSDDDVREAIYEPKKVLSRLLDTNNLNAALSNSLFRVDMTPIAKDPMLKDLVNFLRLNRVSRRVRSGRQVAAGTAI